MAEYKINEAKSNNPNSVWQHFLKSTTDETAKCNLCFKILKTNGGSTSALRSHLLKIHSISLDSTMSSLALSENGDTNDSSTRKKQKRSTTMETKVSRMFINSSDLRDLFLESGHYLPTSINTIRSIVMNQCEAAKQNIVHEVTFLKKQGHKFSLSADEWTSTRNRRYMNINLHSPFLCSNTKFVNLGLARITGSGTASNCGLIIKERLESFGLCFDDIVGLTTDAASVMVKLGKGLPVHHQLCVAHGIQLAILDVLYKTNNCSTDVASVPEILYNEEGDGDELEDDDDDGIVFYCQEAKKDISNLAYKPIIEKVRKTVKIFRKSPTKNDLALQKHVVEAFGKELALVLDCKTRWSSLCTMLERFILLRSCIQKALIDVKSDVTFSDEELAMISHIHEVLNVLKGSVEILCQQDATLITADTVLKCMLMKIETFSSRFSSEISSTLQTRIKERYLNIQGVLKYLEDPDLHFNDYSEILEKPTTDTIKCVVISEISSLFTTRAATEHENLYLICQDRTNDLEKQFASFKDELQHKLNAPKNVTSKALGSQGSSETSECLPNIIHLEMALFENGAGRGKFLTQAYNKLITIKPTSVEPERSFSTAGYLCNKFRTRLNDATLDALIMLRYYYLSQK